MVSVVVVNFFVEGHGSPQTARDLAAHPSRFVGFRANGSHHWFQRMRREHEKMRTGGARG